MREGTAAAPGLFRLIPAGTLLHEHDPGRNGGTDTPPDRGRHHPKLQKGNAFIEPSFAISLSNIFIHIVLWAGLCPACGTQV